MLQITVYTVFHVSNIHSNLVITNHLGEAKNLFALPGIIRKYMKHISASKFVLSWNPAYPFIMTTLLCTVHWKNVVSTNTSSNPNVTRALKMKSKNVWSIDNKLLLSKKTEKIKEAFSARQMMIFSLHPLYKTGLWRNKNLFLSFVFKVSLRHLFSCRFWHELICPEKRNKKKCLVFFWNNEFSVSFFGRASTTPHIREREKKLPVHDFSAKSRHSLKILCLFFPWLFFNAFLPQQLTFRFKLRHGFGAAKQS